MRWKVFGGHSVCGARWGSAATVTHFQMRLKPGSKSHLNQLRLIAGRRSFQQ